MTRRWSRLDLVKMSAAEWHVWQLCVEIGAWNLLGCPGFRRAYRDPLTHDVVVEYGPVAP